MQELGISSQFVTMEGVKGYAMAALTPNLSPADGVVAYRWLGAAGEGNRRTMFSSGSLAFVYPNQKAADSFVLSAALMETMRI